MTPAVTPSVLLAALLSRFPYTSPRDLQPCEMGAPITRCDRTVPRDRAVKQLF